MVRSFKNTLLIFFSASVMFACSDSDAPKENMTAPASAPTAAQLPAEVPDIPVADTPVTEPTEIVYLPNQVIYEEAIYKDWPYTEAPSETSSVDMAEAKAAEAKAIAEAKAAELKAVAAKTTGAADASAISGDKPYQVVDGKISANALEGWKTYNGGGCGTCHGKGAIGAVGLHWVKA